MFQVLQRKGNRNEKGFQLFCQDAEKLHTCHCEALFAEAIPWFLKIASLRNAHNDTFSATCLIAAKLAEPH
jgi:hypothetical protein